MKSNRLPNCLLLLLLLPTSALSQARHRPVKPVGKADPYTTAVVATVGRRKITRADVARLYLDYYPGDLPVTGVAQSATVAAEINRMAPYLFDKQTAAAKLGHKVRPAPTRAEVEQTVHRIFRGKDPNLEALVQILMGETLMEEAAARRHLPVSAARVSDALHEILVRQAQQANLPPMPDRQTAAGLGLNYDLLWRRMKERQLRHDLTLSDLNDQLGHEPQTDDFYTAHLILIAPKPQPDRQGALDWDGAQAAAAALRAEIVAGRQDFSQAAAAKSDDPSRKHGGNLGPMVRTLLAPQFEEAVRALKPGEITPPIRLKNGYALMRVDRRGADLDETMRQFALERCARSEKRSQNALSRVLKSIPWTTTVGTPPEWIRRPAID